MYFRPASWALCAASSSDSVIRTLASLISIGRLTPAITSTLALIHDRDRQVGRRAAEHVGEQHDAVALLGAGDAVEDLGPTLLHVVVRADADGGDVDLPPDDVLERRDQLLAEPSVGDDDQTDHGVTAPSSPGRV